uniref:Uncharacterized protein n=1 Tax=Anopheles darlingi TaxID=43151 RepID=A0A2M4DQZ1_ANODA
MGPTAHTTTAFVVRWMLSVSLFFLPSFFLSLSRAVFVFPLSVLKFFGSHTVRLSLIVADRLPIIAIRVARLR